MLRSEALFSPDRRYRYWLVRVWDEALPLFCTIGINPSTADERADDPTIRKDIGFGKVHGFGGLLKLNVGAYRATDPRQWRKALDPIGRENTAQHLVGYVAHFEPQLIVAAWGKNGNYARSQCATIRRELSSLMCFGTNGDGTPVHTLMLPYSTPLAAFHDHDEGQNECTTCDRWAGKQGATHAPIGSY